MGSIRDFLTSSSFQVEFFRAAARFTQNDAFAVE